MTTLTLTRKNIEALPGYRKHTEDSYTAGCPACPHDEKENNLVFWPDVGNYLCRKCGLKGFVDSVGKLDPERLQQLRTKREARERAERKRQQAAVEEIKSLRSRAEYYHDQLTPEHRRFLRDNYGLTDESIDRYKIGYRPAGSFMRWDREAVKVDSYSIPYFQNGELIHLRHRLTKDVGGKIRPEFPGLPNQLFNVDRLGRRSELMAPGEAVLIEGEFKAMVADQAGFRAFAIPGAASWPKLIEDIKAAIKSHYVVRLFIALDPDALKQARALAVALGPVAIVARLPGKPDDMLVKDGWSPEKLYRVFVPESIEERAERIRAKQYPLTDETRANQQRTLALNAAERIEIEFNTPIESPQTEVCPELTEHHLWTPAGGVSTAYFYCNRSDCQLCRERQVIKLNYYLQEVADSAYIDEAGNAAYCRPLRDEDGNIIGPIRGPGLWYGKLLRREERRAWRKRYRTTRPNGFISPEIYAVKDGYLALSLAPFEDMQPVEFSRELLTHIVIGDASARASLLFAPPRKQLAAALPRLEIEIPEYLTDRGIVPTVKAAQSILFMGPVTRNDIYTDFNIKAESFDDIRLILEEIGLKSIDNDRLRGLNDHAPDYVVRSINILPTAKGIYLDIYNAGLEGDQDVIERYKRKNLPKLPAKRVDKAIYKYLYMPLSTQAPDSEPEHLDYSARIEMLLRPELV